MTKVVWTAALIVSAGVLTASAQAPQSPQTSQAPQTRRERLQARADQRVQKRFNRLDSNHDGTVSRDEWKGAPKRFDRLDRNHDGVLTKDELARGAAKHRRQPAGG
jgi:Ca2+-binding EF-hand superfamily protein